MESFKFGQILLLLIASQVIITNGKRRDGKADPNQLINSILKDYSKHLPPDAKRPTEDRVGLYINSFHSIDSIAMEYSMSFYLRQSWLDKRLKFNRTNEHGINQFRIFDRYKHLWVPDLFVRNEKKAERHVITVPNVLTRINSTGHVWHVSKISGTYSSPMNLQKFPFDTQMLPIMLESYGYTMDILYFQWLDSPADVDPGVMLPDFTMKDIILFDCSQNYTAGAFPCLEIRFVLKRDNGYYILTLFLPSFLVVLLSCTSFWFGTNSPGARLGLGLFSFLMIMMLTGTGRLYLPKVTYITAMDVWFLACLLFVFLSILELVVVTAMANRKGNSELDGKGPLQRKIFHSNLDKVCAGVFPILFILFVVIYVALYTA